MSAIPGTGLEVTFHGVRGSTPCHGDEVARYGGNTSCVSVRVPGHDPILLDIGTGARYFGLGVDDSEPFRGTCLLSHLHWDHVQGLPFFPPLLRPGGHLDIIAPLQDDDRTIDDIVLSMLHPPLFPVGLDAFPGDVRFTEVGDDDFEIGEVRVRSRFVPHLGSTLGFRLEWNGHSLAYVSDHQQPSIDPSGYVVPDGVRDLCAGVDLLIHDAQYTAEDFAWKSDWGHCTDDFAVWLASECRARTLALYHHDPLHDDDRIDAIVAAAVARSAGTGVEVIAAREGLTLCLGS